MPLTVNKVNDKVCRRLRYRTLPTAVSILDVCNDAGQWITGIREWNHLQREPLPLDITAGQEYILLPADMVSLIGFVSTESGPFFTAASIQDVEQSRIGTSANPAGFLYALVTPASTVTGLVRTPRIEIGPTPTQTLLAGVSLIYLAGWVIVTADTDHIVIPAWLEAAYVEACVAFAAGVEQEAGGSIGERLQRNAMPLVEAAALRDGTLQANLGVLGTGAAGDYMDTGFYWPGRFQNPTL